MPPDQIYQPIVSDDDDESETPSPASELSIVNPAEFRRKPDDERDDLTVEDATPSASDGLIRKAPRVRTSDRLLNTRSRATDQFRLTRRPMLCTIRAVTKWARSCARRGSVRTKSKRWRPTRLRGRNELSP